MFQKKAVILCSICKVYLANINYTTMQKRNLSFAQLFNLSFGFFGVQIAYALQSANISRIFSSLGADPHSLSFFWVLPPLMGMIVQPLVGKYSDRTWNRLGRRKPYLLIGAIIAVTVMMLLPNAGELFSDNAASYVFLGLNSILWFGVFSLIFLDTSINVAMQPFKMMVGDMVNEEQKGLAYSIQSFLCNAGSLVGYVFPYLLTALNVANTAALGHVPNTVKYSFYIGALILILCVLYTFFAVKEMNPEEYAAFHGLDKEKKEEEPEPGLLALLRKAPKTFWTISVVQFFCWAAFLYMWTYTAGAIAKTAFDAPDAEIIETFGDGGNTFTSKYVYYEGDSVVPAQFLVEKDVLMSEISRTLLTTPGTPLLVSDIADNALQLDEAGNTLLNAEGKDSVLLTIVKPEHVVVPEEVVLETKSDVNVVSKEYNDAGNWVGILFAIQAIGSIIWAALIPSFKRRKLCYSLSLILGGIGFISTFFVTKAAFGDAAQYILFASFALIGCAWAAMLALPFTIFTNSLKDHIGSYLGLFNCTICLPQIIAALCGGLLLKNICGGAQAGMLVIAGVLLILGSLSVVLVKENKE